MIESTNPATDEETPYPRARYARGSAPASGLNFQANVTAIAAVHLLEGSRIGWLDELANDTPLAVWAESGGPGDDLRLELPTATIEVQAKRGLAANGKLWDAMLSLAYGLRDGRIDFGVLAVSPDSSRTVTHHLEQDLRHIGSGRRDRIHGIGTKWIEKLEAEGLNPTTVSRAMRIQTIAATDGNIDAVRAAKVVLARVCGSTAAAEAAWQALVDGAHALIARKGRWDLLAVVRLLSAAKVPPTSSTIPASALAKAIGWAQETNQTFTVFGAAHPLQLDDAWISLKARRIDPSEAPADPEAAIARYRGLAPQSRGPEREEVYDAEFLGRFKRRGVVVAGPGLGKTTLLRRQAQRYARDGYPVLKVQLRNVAASLSRGETLEATVFRQGLDGSGVDPREIGNPGGDGWILLADGLDECGSAQDDVAEGLLRFSAGHPSCRIILTTRPIGYETKVLADWSHYELIRPDSSAASANVGRLIRAIAPQGSELTSAGYAAASQAFRRGTPATAIATDPQLLGIAASLIVRGEPLGRSRVELFQQLFSCVERGAVTRGGDTGIDLDLCHAVLDHVGWAVTAEPLSSFDSILRIVAAGVADRLATPLLAASRLVREAAGFWEDVGVIERIHHRHTPLLAFVHKSFGEYAAARHLASLDPALRRAELRRIASSSQWAEVLTFAAGLGIGPEVINVLLCHGARTQAVEIAADPAVDLSREITDRLTETVFGKLESEEDLIRAGRALAALAARHPPCVGPRATARLHDPNEEVRRIAWACVVAAGPEHHDPDEAARQSIEMLARAGPGVRPSLLGGIRLMRSERYEITRRMALTNLELVVTRWTSPRVEQHVEGLTRKGNAATMDFLSEVARLVEPLGIHPRLPEPRISSAFDMIRIDSDYGKAEARAVTALLDGITEAVDITGVGAPAEPLDITLQPLVQIGGLIRLIGFWEVPASDVWAWSEAYDGDAVAEVLRILISLTGLDTTRLAREAETVRRKLAEEPRTTFLWALNEVPDVHIDDPPWENLAQVKPNVDLVERTLAHESEWVVQVATEILAYAGGGAEHVTRLMVTASGLGFASAGYLATRLPEPVGSGLILDRLEGKPAPGLRHLFRMLAQTGIGWDSRVAGVSEKHLLGTSEWTATAAADFVLAQVQAGSEVSPQLLWRAYWHWQQHEPRQQENGAIPDSPRDPLFKALVTIGDVSDEALIEASVDYRHDVSRTAIEKLLARAAEDANVARLIGAGIETGTVGPYLIRELIAAAVQLDPETIENITRRLQHSDPRWRLAASGILSAKYLPQDRIDYWIRKLVDDEHAEIREAAARASKGVA